MFRPTCVVDVVDAALLLRRRGHVPPQLASSHLVRDELLRTRAPVRDGIGEELHAHHLAAVHRHHQPRQQVRGELEAAQSSPDPYGQEVRLLLILAIVVALLAVQLLCYDDGAWASGLVL